MDERAPSATASDSGGFALTQGDINEFKGIIQEEFGVEMTDQDAWCRVIELLHLFRSLLGPIPEDPERFTAVRTLLRVPSPTGENSAAVE